MLTTLFYIFILVYLATTPEIGDRLWLYMRKHKRLKAEKNIYFDLGMQEVELFLTSSYIPKLNEQIVKGTQMSEQKEATIARLNVIREMLYTIEKTDTNMDGETKIKIQRLRFEVEQVVSERKLDE